MTKVVFYVCLLFHKTLYTVVYYGIL